jgi:serine/threonine protein kinase
MTGLSVGSSIAGCRLEAVAGRGGMGVVYRATQVALDRLVAVKAMAPQLAEDEAYRERFQRESRLAASIDHPNVIPVYEAGELDGTLYLIMRWVDGTDLRALIEESGGLAPAHAVGLLRPVASALAAAHRRGLVHRDVKPANVLITRGGDGDDQHVYLTDFGIARRTDTEGGMTRTGVLVGTLDYTAPERIEGGRGTPASDIYAFGCMLFETLTGRVPFDRPTELTKMHAHLNDPVPSARGSVPDVSERLEAIIARAMAKDPADRFESAAELSTALARVQEEAATDEVEFRARLERAELPTDETDLPAGGSAEPPGDPPPAEPATAALPPPRPSTVIDVRPPAPATLATPRAPRRRGPLAVGGLAVAAVVGVAIALLAGGGGGKPTHAGPPAHTGSTAPTGPPAAPAVVIGSASVGSPISLQTPGAMWANDPSTVLAVTGNRVDKLDRSGSRLTRYAPGGQPSGVAVEPDGRVWVTASGPNRIVVFGKGTRTPIDLGTKPTKVSLGSTAAWIETPGSSEVTRIDLHTLASQSVPVDGPVASIGEAYKKLWVAADSGHVTVLNDNGQLASLAAPSVPPNTVAIAHSDGVWFLSGNGTLTRIDPRQKINGQPVGPHYLEHLGAAHVPNPAADIAALGSQHVIWVSSGMTVTGFNTHANGTPQFAQIRFAAPPGRLAVRKGILWVAVPTEGVVYPITFSAP